MVDSSFLDSSIVRVDSETKGIILFALNIFLPGLGTFISAFMDTQKSQINILALVFGIM